MGLISGVAIDGDLIKSTLDGIGQLAKDIRSALTGEVDAAAKAAIELKLLEIENQGLHAQIEVNKVEAGSSSVFVAGWRPAVGWVCCLGLLYSFIIQPLGLWAATIYKVPGPPVLDMGVLLQLLVGLLGLSAFRSWEKKEGVAR